MHRAYFSVHMKLLTETILITGAAASALLFCSISASAQTDDSPYRVIYEENGMTLRRHYAENGEDTYPFPTVCLSGITKQHHTRYMNDLSSNKPLSAEMTFNSSSGKLYLYDTVTLRNGQIHHAAGAYIDSDYSIPVADLAEVFEKDGVMLYTFTFYDEAVGEETAAQVQKAKHIIAECTECTVNVMSGDDITDVYGHSGDYTSSVELRLTTDISELTLPELKPLVYTGKTQKPEVTLHDIDYELRPGEDLTVKYRNCKKIGTGSVIITGKGRYSGSVTLEFSIVPPAPSLSAVRAGNRTRLVWSGSGKVDAYVIYCSKDGGKSWAKLASAAGSKSGCKLRPSPDSGYLYKVRAYTKTDGKKYFSDYSASVSVE